MTWTIRKRFTFSASHVLDGLPPGHQCGRLHGHNYAVILELRSDQLDEVGFVVDFGQLRPFRDYLDERLDHQHLNDALGVQPTAEILAAHLYDVALACWPQTCAVTVQETETSTAEYRP